MPRELYNEGRVVGYSAYEIYVKHALSEFPDENPASEREWLAAQIGNGSSMILEVPVEASSVSGVHYVDFPLPENSKLLTANVIIGSEFFGVCECGENHWATKVMDYGQGISNTSSNHPNDLVDDATTYPRQTIAEFDTQKSEFLQYMKIQDAVVLQPGSWEDSHTDPPKDFIPNYHKYPVVRIIFASRITSSFYLLLTGFSHRSIIAGIAGLDSGSIGTEHPQNGDFLGPEVYPWANKIIFMIPPISSYYLRKYLKSGHENRVGTRKNNLKIEHDENSIDTIFTSSYLYSADGITLVGPTTEGGDIAIGSKVVTGGDGSKYIKVEQSHSDSSHIAATTLKPSKLVSQTGIGITQPSTPGGDIKISSKIVKVDAPSTQTTLVNVVQESSDSSDDATTTLRVLKVGNGLKVENGTLAFDLDYLANRLKIKEKAIYNEEDSTEIESWEPYPGLSIEYDQNNEEIIFTPWKIHSETPSRLLVKQDKDTETWKLEFLSNGIPSSSSIPNVSNIWAAIQNILNKIPGDNSVDSDSGVITFQYSDANIAVGNMNIYSTVSSANDKWIRTHTGNPNNGDLKVK